MKWLKWKGRRLSTASACRFLRPASMISSTLCSAPQQQRSPPPPLSLLVRSKMWKPTRYDCTFLCHRSRFRFDSFVKMSEFGYIWIICTLFDSASVTKGTEPATFTSSVVKVNACFVRTPPLTIFQGIRAGYEFPELIRFKRAWIDSIPFNFEFTYLVIFFNKIH